MSAKDLEPLFNHLNTAFIDLQSKLNVIISKYEELERKLENQKKASFKCRVCAKKFENTMELQKHKNEEGACHSKFKCNECDKTFQNENQLSIHKKKAWKI